LFRVNGDCWNATAANFLPRCAACCSAELLSSRFLHLNAANGSRCAAQLRGALRRAAALLLRCGAGAG